MYDNDYPATKPLSKRKQIEADKRAKKLLAEKSKQFIENFNAAFRDQGKP